MTRVLSTNDTNTVPGAIVIVEVASSPVPNKLHPDRTDHTLRCWSAIAGRIESGKWTREKQSHGLTGEEFWSFVNFARQSGHPTTICGSSIAASVSMLGFWGQLESGNFALTLPPTNRQIVASQARLCLKPPRTLNGILISNGPPTVIIGWHKDRWKLTILDISNFLDKPSRELASLAGLPYPEWPARDSPHEDWLAACESRCRVTQKCFVDLVTWQNRQELGRFSVTISSLALAAFRHRFMRDRIELPETQDERDYERQGYYNGRVEALWTGRVHEGRYYGTAAGKTYGSLFDEHPPPPYHVVDARSFYAAVATFEEVPVACIESHIEGQCTPPGPAVDPRSLMATVTLSTDDGTYPYRGSAGCIFSRGTFHTTLCGPELNRAVKSGHVTEWHAWRQYRLEPALRWYAEGLWAERVRAEQGGEPIIAALCKSLLARIHGKFLQRAHRWSVIPGKVAPAPWHTWHEIDCGLGIVREYRSIGWQVQIKDDGGDADHCFPAIAGWVTSYGREYLRTWMGVAGARNVLYVGCDSLIVTDDGLRNLQAYGYFDPPGVGSLRLQGTANDIEICAANHYTFGDRQVVAGRSARELRIVQRRWTSERRQGLEEIFLNADRSCVTNYTVGGLVSNYTTPGTVGPGGWIEPPTLHLGREQCLGKVEMDRKSHPELSPIS